MFGSGNIEMINNTIQNLLSMCYVPDVMLSILHAFIHLFHKALIIISYIKELAGKSENCRTG